MTIPLTQILEKSQQYKSRIVFPDIDDERILQVVIELLEQGQTPIICGKKEELKRYADIDIEKLLVPDDQSNIIFAAQALKDGGVDAMIGGNISTTRDVIIGLLKNVGSAPGIKRISSYFLVGYKDSSFIFTDGGLAPDPSAQEVVEIITLSSQNAESYGIKPKIALLSGNINIDKFTQAAELSQTLHPDIDVSTNIDFEEAYKSEASIYVFPDLNAGNICYKVAERMGEHKWLSSSETQTSSIEYFEDSTGEKMSFVYPKDIAYPDPKILADIVYASLADIGNHDISPRVAFLSFSTKGSAKHTLTEKTQASIEEFQKILLEKGRDNIEVIPDETQFDAALILSIGKKKGLEIDTPATVFVFPDHHSGLLATQIARQIGGATMIGPLIQGLAKIGHDLSRGAKVEDIITSYHLTNLQIGS